jgi:hypothetical protein
MSYTGYFDMLGLNTNASVDEIKKAYRKKARLYHPDINSSPEAKDLFIQATEAYEFLISNYSHLNDNEAAYHQAMKDWRKYRQDRSRQRATAYARASYIRFKKTSFYRTTRILNGTSIIYGLAFSVVILLYTVFGYLYRLKHPLPEKENPSVMVFLMFLLIGMTFFAVSVVFLKAHIETSRKRKKKRE